MRHIRAKIIIQKTIRVVTDAIKFRLFAGFRAVVRFKTDLYTSLRKIGAFKETLLNRARLSTTIQKAARLFLHVGSGTALEFHHNAP